MPIQDDEYGVAQLVDSEAEALILECGILDKFRLLPGMACPAAIITDHPTHYILAQRFSGYSDAKDNGYLAICLSKAKFSADQFHQFAEPYLAGSGAVKEVTPFRDTPTS